MPVAIAGDGSLESALALSAATGRAFVLEAHRRRARGSIPSGFRDFEASITRLFAELCGGRFTGGAAGDGHLAFEPGAPRAGSYRVELPGEAPLLSVLRAAALPLGLAGGASELTCVGSTHAPGGDSFEVVSSTWVWVMKRMGFDLEVHLERAGFAPRGGGEVRLRVLGPTEAVLPIELGAKKELESIQILSAASSLPVHVQQRQASRARAGLSVAGVPPVVQLVKLRAAGSGSAVAVTGTFGGLPITVGAVAGRGVSAESVGEQAAREFRRLLAAEGVLPVCLVSSLLAASALADGSSRLAAPRLPPNVRTEADWVQRLAEREVAVDGKPNQPGTLRIGPRRLQ